MLPTNPRRASRNSLLAGASTALALFVAISSASAQSTTSASGNRTLTNEQLISNADQIVGAENMIIASVSPVTSDATVRLDDNSLAMSARGNQASGTLSSDGLAADHAGTTDLSAGAQGVSADGALVIANRQAVSNADTGTVPYLSAISIDGGAVSGSTLGALGNIQEGRATANGADEAIAATGAAAGSAGIASYQSMDSGSQSSGRADETINIKATTLSASTVSNAGNIQRGIATGNAVTTSLTVNVDTVDTPPTVQTGPAAMLTATSADPTVSAHYGILTDQSAAGLIKGRAGASDDGPAYHVGVSNVMVGSTIASDANGLLAASYGNNAANGVGIEATSITGAAVAASDDIQNTAAAVKAFTIGGSAVDVGFGMSGSSVSASDNDMRAVAAANLASDSMTVKTVWADTGTADSSSQASALTTAGGGAQHDAAFGVQTVQDFGTSAVSATQIRGTTLVDVAGPVVSSHIATDANLRMASASGNSAESSLDLAADTLGSTAAVNLVQRGNGSVAASLGSAPDPTGTQVTATQLADSSVSISRNDETATALGNDGTASLTIDANRLASAPGQASSGMVDAGYGAKGTNVLAADQTFVGSDPAGGLPPSLTATVVDRSGLTVSGDVTDATVTLDRNAQRANAVGNSGTNKLTVSANALDAPGGIGLSSSQHGQAIVAATSSKAVVTPGALAASRASLSNNSNIAYAAMNNVDNALAVTGRGRAVLAADLSSDALGQPVGSGDAVLTNRQFAGGSVDASATGALLSVGANDRLAMSSLTIADNETRVDASANRAQNSVSLGDGVAGGLVNSQVSAAPVHAVAASDLRFSAGGTQGSLTDSVLSFDGNVTSATARGNAADNALGHVGTEADIGGAAHSVAGSFGGSGSAPLALLNQQANLAAVAADTGVSGVVVPLNGTMSGAQLGISGNSLSATAYGNSANSAVTVSALGAAPAASLVNMQTNSGPVSAAVTGAAYRAQAGAISGSSIVLAGNQISAAATGNLASSTITAGH